MKPTQQPRNPCFGSGPCAKRPGWSWAALDRALLGRSHRSRPSKAQLKQAIEETRTILGIPADYLIGIVPGSNTGAFEAALWLLLGPRPVDVVAYESFGKGWAYDINEQLKLGARVFQAGYGEIPDLQQVDWARDVVYVWNGTTSGARVPNGDWIADDRLGLSICDGTSAAFAMEIPWPKMDVFTFSWQKCLGSEGAHGMLVLSPRAVERLNTYQPPWPLPKMFWRLKAQGKVYVEVFEGNTVSTPSMMCVADYLDSLAWAQSVGGLPGLIARTNRNFAVIDRWIAGQQTFTFLTREPACRSTTSVCVKLVDPAQAARIPKLVQLLDAAGVAHDIGPFHDAPPSLRIWCGPTVETNDLELLMLWIEWAFAEAGRQGRGN